MNESRRNFILNALKNNTVAEVVHLDVGHVIECIGLPLTEKIAIYNTEMTEQIAPLPGPNSAIPREKSFKRTGISGFKRLELIEALESGTAKPSPENSGSVESSGATDGPGELPGRSSSSTEDASDPALGS